MRHKPLGERRNHTLRAMEAPFPFFIPQVNNILDNAMTSMGKELLDLSTFGRHWSDTLRARATHHWTEPDRALTLHALTNITETSFKMAKKIAESKGKTKTKAEFKGFANVELSVEEKAEMKQWIREQEKVGIELDEMAASGYKMTFFKSEATGGYQATAFCMDSSSVNAGFILSAFAPHWWDALAALAYKHAVKCEGVWPTDKEATGDLWG